MEGEVQSVALQSSILPKEVQGFLDFVFGGGLVDADVADVAQEGEVDGGADVLLVVVHQFQQTGIVVTGDGHLAIVLANEAYRLAHLVRGETSLRATQVQFDYQSPGYCIAVQHGLTLQGQRLPSGRQLPKGIYIIRKGNVTKKLQVR